jgi:misacylated tRNA(Ala) deacylase
MLGSTQTVHGKNCRLFFACGKRALKLATESAAAVRSMSRLWSSGTDPEAVVAAATRINDSISELKKKEKKLLAEIASYEVDRINVALQTQKTAWVYREECGLDFFTGIIAQIKDVVKEKNGAVVLVSGQEKQAGAIVIFGNLETVEALSAQAKDAITGLKGGGKGEKWQGKVAEWQKGEIEVLRKLVKSYEIKDVPLR